MNVVDWWRPETRSLPGETEKRATANHRIDEISNSLSSLTAISLLVPEFEGAKQACSCRLGVAGCYLLFAVYRIANLYTST
jgi:hypothetical protein